MERSCAICGEPFVPRCSHQRYCSVECRKVNMRAVSKQWALDHPQRYAKRMRDWNNANRQRTRDQVREWGQANPELVNEKSALYRARKHRNELLPLPAGYRALILGAMGGFCATPGCWRRAGHIDHIIPLGNGGPHAMDNFQPMCGVCNPRKGARHNADYRPEWMREIWTDYVSEQLALKLF